MYTAASKLLPLQINVTPLPSFEKPQSYIDEIVFPVCIFVFVDTCVMCFVTSKLVLFSRRKRLM